jgi:cell division protein FtsN
MKKLLYLLLPVTMLVTFNSCEWFNTVFLGRPSLAEMARLAKIEQLRKDSLTRQFDETTEPEQQPADVAETPVAQEPATDASVVAEISEPTEAPAAQIDGTTERYHVIVGSFKVPENAERMAQVLKSKGYTPKVLLLKNGFRCVSVSSHEQPQTAYSSVTKVLTEDFCPDDVWVYDKNTRLHQS